jgi:hypothetical protein
VFDRYFPNLRFARNSLVFSGYIPTLCVRTTSGTTLLELATVKTILFEGSIGMWQSTQLSANKK